MERTPKFFFSLPGSRRGPQQSVSISWSYVATVTALALLTVGICGSVFWYLSFGFGAAPPQSVSINGMTSPASLTWEESGLTRIEATDMNATAAALGYAHATQHPWQMMLWRQTAMGELSAWFGPSLLSLDRFNKQLRFAGVSEATFNSLPADQQALLQAYAAGVNEAISKRQLMAHDDFAFLGADVSPWAPWHGLLIERLFAWLSTNWDADTEGLDEAQSTAWEQLVNDDLLLHQFLQVYDFQFSFAGAWHDGALPSSNRYFYQRLAYGASANPIFHEINLAYNNQPDRLVVTLPGSLLLLAAHGPSTNWALLPRSTLAVAPQTPGLTAKTVHERITNRDGTEFLATFKHYAGILSLAPELPDDSTTYALNWNGFDTTSDAFETWRVLQNQPPTNFKLLSGDGLWSQNDAISILGSPARRDTLAHGLLTGNTQWTGFIATHMDSLFATLPEQLNPKMWPSACYNPWAATYAPGLFEGIKGAPSLEAPVYQDAITYLRNWDYTYGSSSIGAAIFEAWLTSLGFTDANSRLTMPDSVDAALLQRTFLQTIDNLNSRFGEDLSQWRLEQTSPVYRYYAAWAADSLYSADKTPLSSTNYAPLLFPGKGDASTLCTGSFYSETGAPISTAWESWQTTRMDKNAWYWRKNVTPQSFLERYLISNRPSVEFRLNANGEASKKTILVPAS